MNRFLKIAIALGIVLVALLLATPLLLSSSGATKRIEEQLSEITGRKVELAGTTSLSVFPYLSVSYSNVELGRTEGQKPLLAIDGVKARLSTFSVLFGSARLSEIKLIRPRFNLQTNAAGIHNWLVKDGPISKRIAAESIDSFEPQKLGSVKIEDGIIHYKNVARNADVTLTAVNGSIDWQDTDSAASANLKGIWRGESLQVQGSTPGFLSLLRGDVSSLEFSVNAAPVNIAFQGEIDTRSNTMLKGSMDFSAPSMRRLGEWTDHPMGMAGLMDNVTLTGKIMADNEKLSVDDAVFSVMEHTAQGRLQLQRSQSGTVKVNGTLAFESLTMPNLLELVNSKTVSAENGSGILHGIDFDLRLSAQSASNGNFEMANIAATALVKEGVATFDVGQAEALGGTIAGTLAFNTGEAPQINTNMAFTQIELAQLSALYGQGIVSLTGKGDARFKFTSSLIASDDYLRKLNGDGKITANEGWVEGIDLAGMIGADPEATSINTKDVFTGKSKYGELELDFYIANGVVFVERGMLRNGAYSAVLEGRSDLISRSLALRGSVNLSKPPAENSQIEQTRTLPFFVGGTTSQPLFVNLPASLRDAAPDAIPKGGEDQ